MCHCVQHCPSTGSPVTVGDIQKATRRDTVLGKVYRCIQEGWRDKVLEELQPTNIVRMNSVQKMVA